MAGLTRNHKACALYCHLLCTASVTARRVLFNGTAVDVQPGQVVTSRSELSAFLGLTDKEVRGAINALAKLELIEVKGANKYTLITLKNSDTCDNAGPSEGQHVGQEGAKRGLTGGPSEGQPFYKDIECRKRMENGSLSYSASGDAPRTHDSTQKPVPKPKAVLEGKRLESFERFWNVFGYKKGRGGAEKAWAAIPTLTDSLVDQICEAAKKEAAQRPALEAQGRTPKWAQGWLSERRWEDDYEATQPQARPAFQPQGQQKTWDEIRDERNRQACLNVLNELYPEQGFAPQEEEYEPEHCTAEILEDE